MGDLREHPHLCFRVAEPILTFMRTSGAAKSKRRRPSTRFSWPRALLRAGVFFLLMLVWFVLHEHFSTEPRQPFLKSLAEFSWLFVPILAAISGLVGVSTEALLAWLARLEARKRQAASEGKRDL